MKTNEVLVTADRLSKGEMIAHNGKWSIIKKVECTGYSFKIYHSDYMTEVGLDESVTIWEHTP